jgi:NADPH2:quinone reductase
MTQAIRIHETGGPEVLTWDTVEVGAPGPGEVRLTQSAVGLNYIDVYHRTGLYPLPALPDFKPGDRVAYAAPPLGAYAQVRLMPADRLVKLPDGISDQQAAAMMLQGMTVQYLIRRTFRVNKGDTVLFHAAAGGVGLIACQWLKHLGATVIDTVGSDEKAEIAQAHGCDHAINYRTENFVDRVREITDGAGVPVVYDSIGKDTFEGSLDCLAPFGMFVGFGNASGPVPPFNMGILAQKGSLFVTRPTLMTYTAKREDLLATANELFDVVLSDAVKIEINQTYPLAETAQAHRDLEARKTTGSTVLLP